MTGSTKPYLIRAIYEWCVDQHFVPYLAAMVDAHTQVPHEYVKEGQIVLNLGPDATHQLLIGNDLITFTARFNGVAQPIAIPVNNVAAIYARENGQGMAFDISTHDDTPANPGDASDADQTTPPSPTPPATPASSGGRPHLTRIK